MNALHVRKVKAICERSQGLFDALLRQGGSDRHAPGSDGLAQVIRSVLGPLSDACSQLWEQQFPGNRKAGATERLDLSGANLERCLFAGGENYALEGADFRGAKLDGTRWQYSWVKHADFSRASLRRAVALPIICEGASFRQADLSGAQIQLIMSGSRLDFTDANLTDARLNVGNAPGMVLSGANMRGCVLHGSTGSLTAKEAREQRSSIENFQSNLSPEQRAQSTIEFPKAKGGCFIATAACGESHPHVEALRVFRDRALRGSPVGDAVVRVYETLSPPLAQWIGRRPNARRLVRTLLIRPLAAMVEGRSPKGARKPSSRRG